MQLKNSMLLLTALTAGSSVARLHGHERRHLHHAGEKREVGDTVYATMNGVLVSWINEWSGEAKTTDASVPQATPVSNIAANAVAAAAAASTSEPSSSESDSSSSSGVSDDWTNTPADGEYCTDGFGGRTEPSGSGIFYKGNVGKPWGSNIIEVSPENAKKYKHVAQFTGSDTDPMTVVFWNKIGPKGGLNGWYGNSALTLHLKAGETKYVAFDENSQGGWGAAKGDELPMDQYGGYSCTWGEFDFDSQPNQGWSGWDVSAIQAENAGHEVQGMKICNHAGELCSVITHGLSKVIDAYTAALAAVDGIGGKVVPGPTRLVVNLDYKE
ncbi:allergen Asp F4 [Aspergillus novofumigatus IBT 16806]|uniref:Allergen Asp F4 n=1 Tax=Aspergillus novofumigatus (strain IBT 16806) TaxID=1392255 RepID=A0A2I1CL15_ASPN1|nr:allergen Asp F4 [Aspergillus novofumigatus IBT 16806]PKX98304.1 allergen Asp F4 [Aspergillus novofumigatus IBT 16806]